MYCFTFPAPDTVENLRVTNVTDFPRTLNISWARPTSPKGIIRQYVIFFESSSEECYKINVSCLDCNTEAPKQCESTVIYIFNLAVRFKDMQIYKYMY